MSLYRQKTNVQVEAIQLNDIGLVSNWLFANYGGHWSIESDHDPATIFLAADTAGGPPHGRPGMWAIARQPLPAATLQFVDDATFQANFEPAP